MYKHIYYVFYVYSFPVLLRCSWHITVCKFKVYKVLIWYTSVYEISCSVSWHLHPLHKLPLLFVVRTFKICLSLHFQAHNTVLLTIFLMLCITSPDLTHPLTASFDPLTNDNLFPPLSAPGNHHFFWRVKGTSLQYLFSESYVFLNSIGCHC